MNHSNTLTAQAFGKLEAEARKAVVKTADHTDGSAERSRAALKAVTDAESWWDRWNFHELDRARLALVAAGVNPSDPTRTVMGLGFTAQTQVMACVARTLLNA